jgi:hypothetical protein
MLIKAEPATINEQKMINKIVSGICNIRPPFDSWAKRPQRLFCNSEAKPRIKKPLSQGVFKTIFVTLQKL